MSRHPDLVPVEAEWSPRRKAAIVLLLGITGWLAVVGLATILAGINYVVTH